MRIDLTTIYSLYKDNLEIDIETSEFETITNNLIKKINNLKVNGLIYKDILEELNIDIAIEASVEVLNNNQTKTLNYNIKRHIDEPISDYININEQKNKNIIDISGIIWDNILMEIPMHIVTDEIDNIKTSGEGWKFITD